MTIVTINPHNTETNTTVIDMSELKLSSYSTEMPDTDYAESLTRYDRVETVSAVKIVDEGERADLETAVQNLIDSMDTVAAKKRPSVVDNFRFRVFLGEDVEPSGLIYRMDKNGRMRHRNTETPGQLITIALANKSFALIGEYREMSYLTDGDKIIAIAHMPYEARVSARRGNLLADITNMMEQPSTLKVFKRAKRQANSYVLKTSNLLVVDAKRAYRSQFVMRSSKEETGMFIPDAEKVADMKARLEERIAKVSRGDSTQPNFVECESCDMTRGIYCSYSHAMSASSAI